MGYYARSGANFREDGASNWHARIDDQGPEYLETLGGSGKPFAIYPVDIMTLDHLYRRDIRDRQRS